MAAHSANGNRVAVIGAGIAGLSAARSLAQLGFDVTVLERFDLLGGKLKGWETSAPELGVGRTHTVEHGIHGWWRNYVNFNGFLRAEGAWQGKFVPVTDFVLVDSEALNKRPTNTGTRRPRPYNAWLIDEAMVDTIWEGFSRAGIFRVLRPPQLSTTLRLVGTMLLIFGLWDLLKLLGIGLVVRERWLATLLARRSDSLRMLLALLSPSPPTWLDHWSLASFIRTVGLPDRVNQLLDLFQAMVTYGSPDKVSSYHIARCLDFYLFRSKGAFWFSLCAESAQANGVLPLVAACREAGVRICTHTSVERIETSGNDAIVLRFDGRKHCFDYVVSAVDIAGAQRLVRRSEDSNSATWDELDRVTRDQRLGNVKIIRLWLRGRIRWRDRWNGDVRKIWGILGSEISGCPFDFMFVLTPWQAGVSRHDGEVVEVHLSRAQRFDGWSRDKLVARAFVWIARIFPELDGPDEIIHIAFNEVLTFSSAPTGHTGFSPVVDFSPRLKFCGDWAHPGKHPFAYMEKAFVTGLQAAGAVAKQAGRCGPEIAAPPASTSKVQRNAGIISAQLDEDRGPMPRPAEES